MRTPASDSYAVGLGVSLYLAGTGTQGGVSHRFAWPFRLPVVYLDPNRAMLRFGPIAAADALFGNSDGEVSLAELDQVKLAYLAPTYSDADGGSSEPKTLQEHVYGGLFPEVVRYRGGNCETSFARRLR